MATDYLRMSLESILNCFLCLKIYKDPVFLTCGHSFCRMCITGVLDTQKGPGGYSCPECSQTFQKRPAMYRNLSLRNLVKYFLSTKPDKEESLAFCTCCVDNIVPAVKYCMLCEANFCDKHLKVHSKSPEHVLCPPSASPENRRCSLHRKLHQDPACIGVLCLTGDHAGHAVGLPDKASEKKKKVRNVLQEVMPQKAETENHLQKGKKKEPVKVVGEKQKLLTEPLKKPVKGPEDLTKEALGSETKKKVSLPSASTCQVSNTQEIQKLEVQKEVLFQKVSHIEKVVSKKMSCTEESGKRTDPVIDLQQSDDEDYYYDYYDDDDDYEEEDARERFDKQSQDRGDVDGVGSSNTGLSDTEANECFHTLEPADILLDVQTAGNGVQISGDRKTASRTWSWTCPTSSEGFQYPQVLSTQHFSSGRNYWDMDVGESQDWRIGVCVSSRDKRGWIQSPVGYNTQSWCLENSGGQYTLLHRGDCFQPADKKLGNKIRVYLDYEAGKISFYALKNPIRHLHTFTATFTEPLHVTLGLFEGSIKIC